jgi:2-oxoglutarate dehydrogenase complex dehydrogenase (E1) component-like enzyme
MDTFDSIARANPEYVEALYRRYREDPRSVDERWALVFAGYDFALAGGPAQRRPGDARRRWPISSTLTVSWVI